jgi:hypothetical protein
MEPRVFISSTIKDLSYLREGVRDAIEELHYRPVMSEFGEIGYYFDSTAEDSCYLDIKACHLAIIIVGMRYGSLGSNGLSITHNEYLNARTEGIPVIFLVQQEVLIYKKLYEHDNSTKFPDMENPEFTFKLITDFSTASVNNGFVTYSSVNQAKQQIKLQLASLFAKLLTDRRKSTSSETTEILREVINIKQALKKTIEKEFVEATDLLMLERNSMLLTFLKSMFVHSDQAVNLFLKYPSLQLLISAENWNINHNSPMDFSTISDASPNIFIHTVTKRDDEQLSWGIYKESKTVYISSADYKPFVKKYKSLRQKLALPA